MGTKTYLIRRPWGRAGRRYIKQRIKCMEDWIDSAKADRESGMSYRAIAKKYNKAYGTVYRHINGTEEVEGREEPKPSYTEGEKGIYSILRTRTETQCFITFQNLEETFNLYCIAHLTLNQVSLKMNLTRREFYAIKTAFDITKDSMPFTPKQIDQLTAEEIAEKYRVKKKQYALTKIETNKHADIENRIKQMDTTAFWHDEIIKKVNQIDARPYEKINLRRDTEAVNVVYIADVHAGLEVDNYFNQYNIQIMHERFRKPWHNPSSTQYQAKQFT